MDLDFNYSLASFDDYNSDGFYSELYIKGNWDQNVDIQYDQDASWYIDSEYNLTFQLSTEEKTTYVSKLMDGGREIFFL